MKKGIVPLLFVIIVVAIRVRECEGYAEETTMLPPKPLPWLWWADGVVNKHFTNMTAEFVKDGLIKLRLAKKIQHRYKDRAMFKIGAISSSIQTLFDKMILLYRNISDLQYTRNRPWLDDHNCSAVNNTLNALSIAQGHFNRIRLEKNLFQKELEQYAIKSEEDRIHKERLYGPPPDGGPTRPRLPKGGMFARRSNREDYMPALFNDDELPDFNLPALLPIVSPKRTLHHESRRKSQPGNVKTKEIAKANSLGFVKANPAIAKSYLESGKELELSLRALSNLKAQQWIDNDMTGDAAKHSAGNERYNVDHQKKGKTILPISTLQTTKKRIWKARIN